MTYKDVILVAIKHYPIIIGLFLIPYLCHRSERFIKNRCFDTILFASFVLYMTCMFYLVILPLPSVKGGFAVETMAQHIQLRPFAFVQDTMKDLVMNLYQPSTYLNVFKQKAFYQMAFNVIMFVPLGMYLTFWKGYGIKRSIVIGFLISMFFEWTQLTGLYGIYAPYRLFDVDDLMVNTLGTAIGCITLCRFKLNGNVVMAYLFHLKPRVAVKNLEK